MFQRINATLPAQKILLVENPSDQPSEILEILSENNFKVIVATSPEEALYQLEIFKKDIGLILCDIQFKSSYLSAVSLIEIPGLTNRHSPPVIVMTETFDENEKRYVIGKGATDYTVKNLSNVQSLINKPHLLEEDKQTCERKSDNFFFLRKFLKFIRRGQNLI